ncbi:MAG TPA: DUF1385 domain-containing protein [Ktedonobacteraceae bacterium]|jgi:uncharacterized protein YqhQ
MPRFYYGGQAIMEGVMMRGRQSVAAAIRRPEGDIYVYEEALNSKLYQSKVLRLPFLRGIMVLWEMMVLGTRIMTLSANIAFGAISSDAANTMTSRTDEPLQSEVRSNATPETSEPSETSEKEMPQLGEVAILVTVLLSLVFAIGLFFVTPLLLANLLRHQIGEGWLNLVFEGVIRLVLLIGYLYLIGRIPDIRRVFGYHGAEHKAINAMEQGDPLDIPHVRRASRVHTRCGTGFLLIVMVVSILVFALIGSPSLPVKIISRIILVPVLAGISYELIRLGAANYRFRVVRWLLAPSLALQGLTTCEPDDGMIECAIASLQRVLAFDEANESINDKPKQENERTDDVSSLTVSK